VAPAATSLVSDTKLEMKTKNQDSNFTFKIPTPVTIQRNQAALVPFLQDAFKGKKTRGLQQECTNQQSIERD